MIRRLPILAALLCALAVLGLGAGTALAKAKPTSNPVVLDCLQHPAGLTGHYTTAQLDHALQVMPPETKEYTSCPDVISRARLASLGKLPGGGTGSSGSFLPTPVLIVLIVLVLGAVTLGAIAVRRQRAHGASTASGDGGEAPTQAQRRDDPPSGPGPDSEPGPGSGRGPGNPPAA